ncbi:hypothetical protein [Mycolicibacterium tusciae]|uniref:hypothetical protein n=1 Tax=Mycolicibacterium tusciae TaxID=75922 RepID=UPI00024A4412|nr:hypothetical protein [Mycolicibacterium tusciae]
MISQSERTIMLGTILLATAVSGATGLVLVQYFSVDAPSSMLAFSYADCFLDWGMNIGRHCFSDYTIPVGFGMRPNPWDPYPLFMPPTYQPASSNYPAAGMVPQVAFGLLGKWLGMPLLGLLAYLLALTIAVFIPAVWAARGARGLERIVVFVACGAVAIPAWAVIDRGNSIGFVVPITLVFLVALCRQRWGLVAVMVVLAALVKPQFVVLAVVLLAARQWRMTGLAVVGATASNVVAYLLWPQDFPGTIVQSARNVLGFSGFDTGLGPANVSFTRAILLIPDTVAALSSGTGQPPEGFLAGPRSILGYAILIVVVGSVLALGRRMPPVMAGIVLLATASLFPAVSLRYYLVFALPIAALIARDPAGPPGSGIFDRLASWAGRRPVVGICVSVATALTIAQIPLPLPYQAQLLGHIPGTETAEVVGTTLMVWSTATLTPILWLVTCIAIIASYARRPARYEWTPADAVPTTASPEPTSTATT